MALAEASVRVVIEVARFERDLRNVVTKAAQRAGKDLERELSAGFKSAAKKGVQDFRNAVNTSMLRAGKDAVKNFQAGMAAGVGQLSGRVGTQIGNGLRMAVAKSGVQAGRGFAQNMSNALVAQGKYNANRFVNAIGVGLASRGVTIGRNAGLGIGRALTQSVTGASGQAGAAAGRQFSLSFGFGTTGVSNRAIGAIAVAVAELATQVAPALNIFAGFPPLLLATAAAGTVAAFAFRGIGDAFDAVGKNDINALQEAMVRLSPAAQAVVREFARMRPALNGVRQALQEEFFSRVIGRFTEMSNLLAGPLLRSTKEISASLGDLADSLIGVFVSVHGGEALERMFKGTADFVAQLRPGIRDLLRGFLEFSSQAAPGLNSIGEAFSRLLSRMGQFLSRAAKSGDALVWVEEGVKGVQNLAETIGDLAQTIGTLLAAVRPLAVGLSLVFNVVTALVDAFGQLPGPIQTAVLAAVLLSRSGLPDFLGRVAGQARQVPGFFRQIAFSYDLASTATRSYLQTQTGLLTASAAISNQSTRTVAAITAMGNGFTRIGAVAAGAGSAIASGIGGALRSVVGFLGGPWGVAFAAAGVALALFSTHQQNAARRVAEWNANVREIQGTLNRSTGAVTQMTIELAAQNDNVKTATTAFQKYGVSAQDVVEGAVRQGAAHERVEAALRAQVRGYVDAADKTNSFGRITEATGLSAEELTTALLGGSRESDKLAAAQGRLAASGDRSQQSLAISIANLQRQSATVTDARTKWLDYFNQTQKAAESQRLIAASIPPAARETQRMADAMGILSDNTSDASAKAAAFNEVMEILAGGTIDVQAATARYNEVLQRVAADTKEAVDQSKGFGDALIQANGQISTATVNGNNLFKTYQDLTGGLSTANGALIDNALKTGDVSGALTQVRANVASAREAFIQQAGAMGIARPKAEELANAYGLIPEKVITDIAVPTYENVRAQVVDVNNRLKELPPNTPVEVDALTEEAVKRLNEVGVKTEKLPNGKFSVTAETQGAKSSLQSLVDNWGSRVLNWVVNIIGGKAMGDIVENAKGSIMGFAKGGTYRKLTPMAANRARIVPPNTWRVIGDRAQGDEAYIPINNSAPSKALLAETARRMGFTLLANGGLMGAKGINAGPQLSVAPGAIVVNAPYANPELVARATLNELARQAAV